MKDSSFIVGGLVLNASTLETCAGRQSQETLGTYHKQQAWASNLPFSAACRVTKTLPQGSRQTSNPQLPEATQPCNLHQLQPISNRKHNTMVMWMNSCCSLSSNVARAKGKVVEALQEAPRHTKEYGVIHTVAEHEEPRVSVTNKQ